MTEQNSTIQYSIVIPVYNTTRVLLELQRRIEQVFLDQIKQSYEIILVDDSSSNPETWPVIEELVKNKNCVSAIQLTQNFGQHAALLCGLAHSKAAYAITMDDDLQHVPEDIPVLISQQEHDVVIGQFVEKKHSFFRNLASNIKSYFDMSISGKPRNLRVTSFCLIRRRIVEQILELSQTQNTLFSSLIFQVSRDVIGVPVRHSPRQEGKSGYSIITLTKMFSRLFINHYGIIGVSLFRTKASGEQQKQYIIKQQIS